MVITAPYGSWASPVDVDLVTGATVGLVGGFVDGDDVYWLESHASQGGRVSLWRLSPDGSRTEVTPDHYVRTTVGEYGGDAATVAAGVVVFSAHPDARVYVIDGGEPRAITPEGRYRYGGFASVPGERRVVCVREDHSDPTRECVNTLVVLDLDGDNADHGRIVAEGADFYGAPSVSADGARIAWHEWDHPNMPWDTTRIVVGSLDASEQTVVAATAGVSAIHPSWAPDGSLTYLADDTGYWNLRSWNGQDVRALHDHPYDLCGPAWVLQAPPYCHLDDGAIGAVATIDGRAHVVIVKDSELRDLGLDLADAQVSGDGSRCVANLAYPDRPRELAVLDWATGKTTTIRRASAVDLPHGLVSLARQITWESPDGPVHAWFYPPANDTYEAPEGELPPAVVISHGGPTAMSTAHFALSTQYWTSRGIALLDVNYGGSTGYGRAYRERLLGQWGVVDVRDCADAARHAADAGLIDPERIAIRGGSAGGYTTLAALTTTDVFAAGISSYGIGDLETLATDTHKFESRYLDSLVAPYPEGRDVYVERSPIHHLDGLSCPMLILQGTEDRVVPPNQAEAMADAVRAKGLPVTLVMYEGEGHGFRSAPVIRHSLGIALAFLGRVFGFQPAGEVPDLDEEFRGVKAGALRRLGVSLIALRPTPGRFMQAGRWVTAVSIGLLGTALLLGPDKGALGLLGAMAANAGREDPFRKRVVTLLVVGFATLASQTIGLLIAPHPWLFAPVITALTVVIVWTWHALMTGPPGPINTLFAGAFGWFMGGQGWTVATLVPITALSWAIASVAGLVILALNPHLPGRQAVEAAEQAVRAYADHLRDDATPDADDSLALFRGRAWTAADEAWNVLRAGVRPGATPRTQGARALHERLTRAYDELVGTIDAENVAGHRATDEPAARTFGLRPLGRPGIGYLLTTGMLHGSRARLVTGRAALAVLIAATTMYFSPVGHPYWAILSALIVLHMDTGRADLTVRAAHRVIGTGLGVVAYFVIDLFHPGEWIRLGIVIVAIFFMELMARTNYAIATLCVTIFALLMTPVTSAAQIDALMIDRFFETLIGVSAAVLVIWLVGRRAPVLLVRRQYRVTIRRLIDVLSDLGDGVDPVSLAATSHRRDLVFEIGRANSILAAARPDDPAALDRWRHVQAEVSGFGFDVVTMTWNPPVGQAAAATAADGLRTIVASLPPISSANIDAEVVSGTISQLHKQFLASA